MLSLDGDSLALLSELREQKNQDKTPQEVVDEVNAARGTDFTAEQALFLQLEGLRIMRLV